MTETPTPRRSGILIERRQSPATGIAASVGSGLLALLGGLIVGGLLFLPFDVDPFSGYRFMVESAFFSSSGLGATLVRTAPLLLVGLGTVIAWRAGFYYLGYEGCLYIGGATATVVSFGLDSLGGPDGLPTGVVVSGSLASAAIAAALWSGVVGVLKAKLGASEVLISLMMNYIAMFFVGYLVSGPIRAPGSLPQSKRLPESSDLPQLFGGPGNLNIAILIGLVMVLVTLVLMKHTIVGFHFRVVGLNQPAADYAGIPVLRRVVTAAAISGFLAGIAGACQVLGSQHRLLEGFDQTTGFEGIVVALLGGLAPVGTAIVGFLYAGLSVGAQRMQVVTGIPTSIASIIQGVIILLVLASALLRSWRIRTPNFLNLGVHRSAGRGSGSEKNGVDEA